MSGLRSGLRSGFQQSFAIHRDDALIGTVKVSHVGNQVSVAEIVDGDAIQVSDQVSPVEPSEESP